ncbi:MAG: hypothetical protein AAF799_37960 [Myxococcota bacterium]
MKPIHAPLAVLPFFLAACPIVIENGDDDGSAEAGATEGSDATAGDETDGADETAGVDETAGASGPQSCAEIDRTMEGELPTIEGDEITLSGVYRISGTLIYDRGQVVTIEPGTVFLMESDAQVYFGWRSDPATVFADGTAEQPIMFCGTEGEPGHWIDLQVLTGTTTDSVFSHVRIEDGGQGDVPALLLTVDATLDEVTVTGNAGPGFELSGLANDSTALYSTGNLGVSGWLLGESAITNLPPGDYTGNGEDILLADEFSDTNVVFHERGVPYRQLEEVLVFGEAGGDERSITIEAGVEYQFCQDCTMLVGWRTDPAVITVQGTEDQPVVFTSSQASPSPGDWNGIVLEPGTRSNSRIEFARFEYGGKSDAANLVIDGGTGTVRDSVFANSAGWGVMVDGEREPGFELANNVYIDNALGAVSDE